MHIRRTVNRTFYSCFSFFVFSSIACAEKSGSPYRVDVMAPAPTYRSSIYTIQVGAFSNHSYASRALERLRRRGIDAYCISSENGLFKVRFGSFSSEITARERAMHVFAEGSIDEYLIVKTDYSARTDSQDREPALREDIVTTTRMFLGMPYRWGRASPAEGFDCSGLTMTVYRLNGLGLPRSSIEQWKSGTPVNQGRLKKGDLVFFVISDRNRVSHVGIYVGGGRFIHAPGKGKNIRIDSLSDHYFRTKFAGGRTFF